MSLKQDTRLPAGLLTVMTVQFFCVVFFITDVFVDYREQPPGAGFPFHISFESVATISLVAAIIFEARYLISLVRRKAQLEKSLEVARTAVHEVIDAHFADWKLSPSETEVATFLVKGLGIPEIAWVRGCAEGTVKAHLNAIYRKSDTRNRGELLSVLIDSLLAGDVKQN
ncbi:helix-turn-helix transcriptional regulator [Amaricoccus tamworthensis]|uniref:helix-turn-helix transcriptional regulator n=1 Tax=Amaricoccus tamworthensis TaxID=57002 RepID=UPI003C7A3BC7